ncbi:MAG: hypothetical protein ACTHZ5_04085 [Micrococcaceae bacterium]
MTETLTTTPESTLTTPASRRPRLARAAFGLLGAGALAFTSMGAASASTDTADADQSGDGQEPVSAEWKETALAAAAESPNPEWATSCVGNLISDESLSAVAEHMPEGPTSVTREVTPADDAKEVNDGLKCTFSAHEEVGGPQGSAVVDIQYVTNAQDVAQLRDDPEEWFTLEEGREINPDYTTESHDGITTVTQRSHEFPAMPFTASIGFPEDDEEAAVIVKAAGANTNEVPLEELDIHEQIVSGEPSRDLAEHYTDTHDVWGPVWDEIPAGE